MLGGGSDEGTLGLKSERKVFVDAGAVKVTMDVPVLPTGDCSWRKELNRNNGLGWAAVSTCMCTEEVEKRKEVKWTDAPPAHHANKSATRFQNPWESFRCVPKRVYGHGR